MIFDKLSPDADFISKIQSQLTVISGNVLYCTHELDKIKKVLIRLENNSNAQKQVDDFYETSPQTDAEEQPTGVAFP